jgi:ribosomal protein RSM22 (predicted rRNA methylase)
VCYETQRTRITTRQRITSAINPSISRPAAVDPADSDEGDDETEERQPWKTLLELSARAPWRVTDAEALPSVPQLHKRKHLQQVYQDRVVNVHKNLVKQREAERRRLLRNDPAKKSDTPLVLYGREETWASLYFRFQPNWAVVSRVLQETQALLMKTKDTNDSTWQPRTILDFGIGCGSASAAALEVFSNCSTEPTKTLSPIEWIHGIDPSQTMRQCAQEMLQDTLERHNLPPRVTFSSYLSSSNKEDATSSEIASFDLALCAYGLNELPYGSAALSVITLLWEKLNDQGVLVVIEPGTPDGFATIRMVRNFLLAAAQEDTQDDFCILAPCTHHGPCPLERLPPHSRPNNWKKTQQDVVNDKNEMDEEDNEDIENDGDEMEHPEMSRGYCSFVHSLPAQRGKSKSEKFSYIVVQKRSKSIDYDSSQEIDNSLTQLLKESLVNSHIRVEDNVPDAMIAFHDLDQRARGLEEKYLSHDDEEALGLELVREERSSFSRIVRAPKKKKGHVFIEGCAAPGRIARYKVTKSASIAAPGLYAAARKSRWGGLWPHVSDLEA